MVIPDDQGMGLKIPDQELADIIFCGKLREFFGKRNDHQVVDALIGKQFNFFIQGIDEPNASEAALTTVRGWGSKVMITVSPFTSSGSFFHLGNHLLMTGMYAIKGSNREYGIAKKG